MTVICSGEGPSEVATCMVCDTTCEIWEAHARSSFSVESHFERHGLKEREWQVGGDGA